MSDKSVIDVAINNGLISRFDSSHSFKLYSKLDVDSFRTFIIDSRFSYFQLIQAILSLDESTEFLIGFSDIYYYLQEDETNSEKISLGAGVIPKHFSRSQLVDFCLSSLSFNALIVDYFTSYNYDLINYGGLVISPNEPYSKYDLTYDDFVIISTKGNVFFTQDKVVGSEEIIGMLSSKISSLFPRFDYFLSQELDFGVPHAFYVDMLLDMFPGYIKVKSLN